MGMTQNFGRVRNEGGVLVGSSTEIEADLTRRHALFNKRMVLVVNMNIFYRSGSVCHIMAALALALDEFIDTYCGRNISPGIETSADISSVLHY